MLPNPKMGGKAKMKAVIQINATTYLVTEAP